MIGRQQGTQEKTKLGYLYDVNQDEVSFGKKNVTPFSRKKEMLAKKKLEEDTQNKTKMLKEKIIYE